MEQAGFTFIQLNHAIYMSWFSSSLPLLSPTPLSSVSRYVHLYHLQSCQHNIFSFQVKVSSFWSWLFTLSKIPELGDTLFIVLRKQQLIFLHWSVMMVKGQKKYVVKKNRFPDGKQIKSYHCMTEWASRWGAL